MKKFRRKKFRFSLSWVSFLSMALVVGAALRLTYVEDMEYKEDEEYNFTQSQLIGSTQSWPWYGIPSGVHLVNPGMSIWVFTVLAKIFRIHHPTDLARAVQIFALVGICMIIPFCLLFLSQKEKKDWLWAFALAMVNPFLVLYQRKLWPEPFLPFFTMLTLMGWWRKSTPLGALIWGCIGACLGQIHMSGFFFSAALFLWTLLFYRSRVEWKYWFLGSVIGALPLLPWAYYVGSHPVKQSMTAGWAEMIQMKYWAFWITDGLGLHLGNPLGLMRGPNWAQISDFVRYPLFFGKPSYLVGTAHLAIAVAAVWIFARRMKDLIRRKPAMSALILGKESDSAFVHNAAFIGCGVLLTATGVVIRRYYMTVTFPLEILFWIRLARPETKLGHGLLTVLWIAECFISANFVGYIHSNQGSTQGDYGRAYHLIQKDKQKDKTPFPNH